jgi:hypothetical protein
MLPSLKEGEEERGDSATSLTSTASPFFSDILIAAVTEKGQREWFGTRGYILSPHSTPFMDHYVKGGRPRLLSPDFSTCASNGGWQTHGSLISHICDRSRPWPSIAAWSPLKHPARIVLYRI